MCGCKNCDCLEHRERRVALGGTFQRNDDGTWSPAVPLGWMEEHGWLARFIFWVRGVEHCNDREGQPRRRFGR